jgi:hypothetical protein
MPVKSGKLTAAIGSSRSGKTQFVFREIAGQKRLMVWDIKGEYPVQHRARNRAELVRLVKTLAGKPGKIAYTADRLADFAFFCRVAQTWVKSHYLAGQSCALVFEETADVTTPAKAPEEYGIILRRFLSYGVNIYAVTQRPAESDKTAIGNASILHVCRLNLNPDRRSAANNTGLPFQEIDALVADQDAGKFEYLHADTGRRKWHKGTLTFAGGKPKFTRKTAEKPL